ncbi:putative ABC transport system permease protein [Cryobacterium mesophilum]|uniref:ABC transporter permease n=1 Tax=Terrimesophilobacter mesophilus TaxID=433647 RepID=A0A4R8V8C9_9MICO|nr:ABC transporter permease [Terrimesophilobacter mesophilus]MBB5632575.1 putative ABC transport system permease protein [Terrimesophilobacter mesophilus]TFB79391.1 ABC transporter permease [Terrimesophilobacter mesophilus]
MPDVPNLLPTLVGVIALAALGTAVLAWCGVPHRWSPLLAILRGVLQLAIISVILAGIITNGFWVGVALLVMFGIAAFTATRRIGWSWEHAGLIGSAMALGISVTLAIVFATGAIEFSARYALAIGGIVIGNAMSIATLAGRNTTEAIIDHWDDVEGWMAIGATPRQSTLHLARHAVYNALVPSIDQTKTTGLVTLPGAFVGAIFGGVSPLEAGRFQVVVLASIMAAGAITAVVVTAWLAPVRMKPVALA